MDGKQTYLQFITFKIFCLVNFTNAVKDWFDYGKLNIFVIQMLHVLRFYIEYKYLMNNNSNIIYQQHRIVCKNCLLSGGT